MVQNLISDESFSSTTMVMQVNCVIDKASLWDVKVGCVLRRVLLKCYWELGTL